MAKRPVIKKFNPVDVINSLNSSSSSLSSNGS